jgi:ubiquinone/menaquinone biosynthesis C-methylase UbiE
MSKKYFDEKAATWDENPMRGQLTATIVDFVFKTVPLNKQFSVLDYGCGTGLLSFLLSHKVKDVYAADISDGMLEQVRKKIESQNVKNIYALNFDVTKDILPEAKYDLITSAMAMHHIEDVFDAITKLSKLLKPGGWIAIADLCSEDGSFHEKGIAFHNGFEPADIAKHLESLKITSVVYKTVFEIPRNQRLYPIFCVCGRKA